MILVFISSLDDLVIGVNLWVFAQSSVNYAKVFDLAQTNLSHREIWRVCLLDSFLCIFLF